MDERVQIKAYTKNWLREQSQIPEDEVLAFIEELEYYAQMYEELLWADYFMHEIMMRDI